MSATEARALCRVTPDPLDAHELVDFVSTTASGGVVLFTGNVRDHHAGRPVTRIDYAAVDTLATRKLHDLADEALARHDVHRVAAIHRTGRVEVGEASVLVAASAAHREEAFAAARHLIDRIKQVLPVWKHEHFADGPPEWAPGFTVPEDDRC